MAHLDTEVLAEFRAGLITGRRGASITAHLAGCDRCTALGEQLAGVSALLAAVPVPAMPDLVAQRLDTVLTAEAARLTAGAASPDHAERAGPDRPGHRATGHRRTPRPGFRLLSARVLAPVAVVVLAAGGYGLSVIAGPGGHVTASSGSAPESAAASAPGNAAVPSATDSRVNTPKSPLVRGAQGTVPRPQRITAANFTLVASSTDFSAVRATFKQQVEDELGRAAPAEAAQPATAWLRACVQNLTNGAGLVRVESARFAGQPATLVVARSGQHEVAWIAGPDCSATTSDVLATTSVP